MSEQPTQSTVDATLETTPDAETADAPHGTVDHGLPSSADPTVDNNLPGEPDSTSTVDVDPPAVPDQPEYAEYIVVTLGGVHHARHADLGGAKEGANILGPGAYVVGLLTPGAQHGNIVYVAS